MAKAKFDKAKAELSLARTHLAFTEIKAPFNGIMDRFLREDKGVCWKKEIC
jgi:membrane fusion protein (multidrug efflux system)